MTVESWWGDYTPAHIKQDTVIAAPKAKFGKRK